MLFLVLAGFAGVVYCWNHESTHMEHFTGMALDLLEKSTKNQEYSPEIWKEFAEFIKYGARDEDLPCLAFEIPEAYSGVFPPNSITMDLTGQNYIKLAVRYYTNFLRANNHYGHGIIRGVGLTYSALGLGDEDVDPLRWAKTNPSFNPKEEFQDGKFWWRGGIYKWSAKIWIMDI